MNKLKEGFIYTRVLPMPKKKGKGSQVPRRRRRSPWPEPSDARAIFQLTFAVVSHERNHYYATAQLELPMSDTLTEYQAFNARGLTKHAALRSLIEEIERSQGFLRLKSRKGVYFQVRGAGMDKLYRGYL